MKTANIATAAAMTEDEYYDAVYAAEYLDAYGDPICSVPYAYYDGSFAA